MKLTFWQKIGYGLLWGACRLVGLLPERILYGTLGRMIYLLLYRVLRYRVRVVRENLSRAFPEKSEAERREIERKFYRHLADVFVDTLLLPSITEARISQRMVYVNAPEVEKEMEGKNWISAMSHFGSWELTIDYVKHTDHRVLAVYRPLQSSVFECFYQRARARFGTQPVAMNDTLREVVRGHRPGERPVVVALIADQTPPITEAKRWFPFLNQETPFFEGLEKMAYKFGMPVYFMYTRQRSPRVYEAQFQLIYDGKEPLEAYELICRYMDRLEAMIRETPHLWMWSHRRWKYTPERVARYRESIGHPLGHPLETDVSPGAPSEASAPATPATPVTPASPAEPLQPVETLEPAAIPVADGS